MKNIFVLFLIGFLISCQANSKSKPDIKNDIADTLSVKTELKKYFDACNTQGCIVIFDNNQKNWIVSDSVLYKTGQLPASTFKIINLLIALETGVIADENEIIKWPGEIDTAKYGFRPEIYRDMTVKEAFEVSAGWVFVELAKKIGREKYSHYLQVCNYGNQNLSEPDIDFWNFGALGISPFNQVVLIRKLFEGNLPFSAQNMEIVKRVMITEQTENYTIKAKTGWTREGGFNTGWWVGYVETKQGVWFFATLLLQDRKYNSANFGQCRKDITKAALKELGVLEDRKIPIKQNRILLVVFDINLKENKMARVSTYLNFPRNTEEAFNFYKSIFGGEFGGNGIARFSDIPAVEGMPPLPEEDKNLVMHIELTILGGHSLMGTDAPESMGFTVNMGNNIYINLEPDTKAETDRLFKALSAGGVITQELQDMFWGDYFGSCTDKYGVQWMFNFNEK